MHQCAALLWIADSRGMLEDEQRHAGFEWSPCCCNSNLADLHLPAQTFSAWKSNSLCRTPVRFIICFQGQQSSKILEPNWNIYSVGKMTPLHTKWWMAEKQTVQGEETLSHFDNWIICHLELFYNICHDYFPLNRVLPLGRIISLLIIKTSSWRLRQFKVREYSCSSVKKSQLIQLMLDELWHLS